MIEFVEYITKSLVDNKDEVKIDTKNEDDGTVVVSVKVCSDDLGKVIGKQGKIANAIRVVTRAISRKNGNAKVVIKISD